MKAGIAAVLILPFSHSVSSGQDPPVNRLQPIGLAPTGVLVDVEAAPPYAYALEPTGLHVLDTRDRANVREIAHLDIRGQHLRMALHESRLYLVGAPARGLAVVDVSEPGSPRLLGEMPDVTATLQDGIEVVDDLGYVLHGRPSLNLAVLDLTAAGNLPRRIASLDLGIEGPFENFGSTVSTEMDALLLLLDPYGENAAELVIVDVEDPSRPRIDRRLTLPPLSEGRMFRDLDMAGDRVHFLTAQEETFGDAGIATFRLHDEGLEFLGETSDPRLEGPIDLIARDGAVFGTFKSAVDLAVFDVSEPRPRLAFTHTIEDPLAAGLGMTMVDDVLYVASDGGPLPVFDVSDPLRPRVTMEWAFEGGWTGDVQLDGDRVVTVRDNSGFEIYDVRDPTRPRRLSRYLKLSAHDPWQSVHVATHGNRVLAVYDSLPAELLDISEPARPVVLSRFRYEGDVQRAVLTPTLAIVGFRAGRLGIVDVSDPAAPAPAGEVRLEGVITDLVVSGGLVVVAHFDGAVSVVDITDPAHPVLTGRLDGSADTDPGTRGARIALSEDGLHAYVARFLGGGTGTTGLTIVDLQGAAGPEAIQRMEIGSFRSSFPLVAARAGEVLILARNELLQIDVEDPRHPQLAARYRLPGPFGAAGFAVRGDVIWVGRTEYGLQAYGLPGRR